MKFEKLKDTHRIVRQVSHTKQIKNDREAIGVLYSAFALGTGHDSLSVAWCEFFEGDLDFQRAQAIRQLRKARPDKKSTAYWTSSISEIRAALSPHKIRALHEPDGLFECHAALRRWPQELVLLQKLATEAIARIDMSEDISDDP